MFRSPVDIDTRKTFTSRNDIKPWLCARLENPDVNLVIERSDSIKIVIRCRSGPISCPFRIRANYSLRTTLWSLSVMCDLHNHPVKGAVQASDPQNETPDHSHKRPKSAKFPNTGMFSVVPRSISASDRYIDELMKKMSTEVAQVISANIWNNSALSAEQKDTAAARFVAEMMDGYLKAETRAVASSAAPATASGPASTPTAVAPSYSLLTQNISFPSCGPVPLSPITNELDVSTQLPALTIAAPARVAQSRGSGPLPPFNSLQNHLPQAGLEAKTLNPLQLMKSTTNDLSEFKVDNIGGSVVPLVSIPPQAPSPDTMPYAGWTSVGFHD